MSNINIDPGSTLTIGTDAIAGVNYQIVKIAQGDAGSATQVSAAAPLNVSVASATLGTVTVALASTAVTVSNIPHAIIDSGNINIATATLGTVTISGNVNIATATLGTVTVALSSTAVTISNNVTVIGPAAHNAAVSGNPVLLSAEARDTLGTVVSAGNVVRLIANRYGELLISAIPTSHVSSNGTPITATTTSVIGTTATGTHLRVTRIHMSNGGATATWVGIRDGAAGTQHYRTYLPQGGVISLALNISGPLDLTTATRLDIVLSAAGSVEYEIDYLTVTD